MLTFDLLESTWDPRYIAAIRRHYTGSRGPNPGKKLAWEILEGGHHRGWLGLGEPPFKLAARRRLGLEDARPLPMTVLCTIYRIEAPGHARASEILRAWHEVAGAHWEARYGWAPVHWESMVLDRGQPVVGCCFRRAGYRRIGRTTGRTARRPPGATHSARVWGSGSPKEVFYRGPLCRVPGVPEVEIDWRVAPVV